MPLDTLTLPRAAALAALMALSACNAGPGTELGRAAARTAVDGVVAQRFPGVPLKPTTDCIIDNATGDEILALAAAAASRDQSAAARTVLGIAQRPEAVQCIAAQGLPAILNTL